MVQTLKRLMPIALFPLFKSLPFLVVFPLLSMSQVLNSEQEKRGGHVPSFHRTETGKSSVRKITRMKVSLRTTSKRPAFKHQSLIPDCFCNLRVCTPGPVRRRRVTLRTGHYCIPSTACLLALLCHLVNCLSFSLSVPCSLHTRRLSCPSSLFAVLVILIACR